MELVDLYTADRQLTGRTLSRNEKPAEGEFMLVVHTCLFSPDGRMLIQKRHPSKDRYPGCWDMASGGFACAGESSLQAALRELTEELGVTAPADALQYAFTVPFRWVLDDFYILRTELPPSAFTLQSEEVTEVRYASPEEIRAMLRSGEFVDYEESIFTRLWELL